MQAGVNLFRTLFSGTVLGAVLGCSTPTAIRSQGTAPSDQATSGAAHAGYRRLKLVDPSRGASEERPVWADVWYPISASLEERPVHYSLGTGLAVRDAPLQSEQIRAWVILSHGAGGSADNYAWLTAELARSGFAVVGVHHYGEARVYGESSLDRLAMFRAWQRAADVAFIDRSLRESSEWAGSYAAASPFGIGHSAGGHTLLVAAGLPYDLSRMGAYCTEERARGDGPRECQYGDLMSADDWQAVGTAPEGDAPRVDFSGLILLEPANGPSFARADLESFHPPVYVFASKPGDFLSFEPHAQHLAESIPHSSLTLLPPGEGHFIFLAECSLRIQVLGLQLCQDAPGISRANAHTRMAREITSQLQNWLTESRSRGTSASQDLAPPSSNREARP